MKNNYPLSRKNNIIVQELDDEVLIYDLNENKGFCLNKTSVLVWHMCNGNESITEISQAISKKLKKPVSEELIWLALDQMQRENLLENKIKSPAALEGLSRRAVIKKVGLSSVIALPVIASLVAPNAANALSGCSSGTLSSGPLINQGRGSGGTCECAFSFTPNGSTCLRGVGFSAICKSGCQCRRTQAGGPGCGVGNLCGGVCE